MSNNLVHIVNNEFFKQPRNIRAIGFDLDGSLTNLYNREIHGLIWEKILNFIPEELRKKLSKHDFELLNFNSDVSLGWFLDMDLGYLVLPSSDKHIIAAREGNVPLDRSKILKAYGNLASVDISFGPNPDHDKPRFLPLCDGFDLVEGTVKSAIRKIEPSPPIPLIREIDRALYQAHHSEDGFKKNLAENPEKYGIAPDSHLRDFLLSLKEIYKVFLLTSSPKGYTKRILDALKISDCFDVTITEATKPACFYAGTPENKNLFDCLANMGVSQKEVLYVGDSLYKDSVQAQGFGFSTVLKMKPDHIAEVERKLGKYASVKFEVNGAFKKPVSERKEETPLKLSLFLSEIYYRVHAIVADVQHLKPLVLY